MEKKNGVTILHVGKLVTAQRECLCVVHSLSSRAAAIRVSVPLEIGQSVTLGLRNGFAVPGIVSIIQSEHVSLIFEEHISISTILAEQRNGRDEREAVRMSISLSVSVTTQTGVHQCMTQDISLFGIRLFDEAAILEEGAQVQILIDGLGKREAVVVWREPPYAGLHFQVALGFKLLDQWINAFEPLTG